MASSMILVFVGHAPAPPPFTKIFVFKIAPIVRVVVDVPQGIAPETIPVPVTGKANVDAGKSPAAIARKAGCPATAVANRACVVVVLVAAVKFANFRANLADSACRS